MKKLQITIIVTFALLLNTFNSSAQNIGINSTGTEPDNSALLDLNSTEKGFLITRNDPTDIVSPTFGLMTLSSKDSCLYMYSGKAWISIGGVGDKCVPFECGTILIDDRDGEEYETIKIGKQCWMSKNLNYAPSSGKHWCYDDNTSNCDIYGRLYDWNTATNSTSGSENPSGVQGVCPDGWHLPSDAEWKELETELGMTDIEIDKTSWRGTNEGEQLKTTSPTWNGNNTSGFTALPGGYLATGGLGYRDISTAGYWWSATENGNNGWRRILSTRNEIQRSNSSKGLGHSVRCLMD